MDHRGNMSGQHRRTKVNHSLVWWPDLTERQQQIAESRKPLKKMSLEELNIWLEVCKLSVDKWKNRRSLRKKWEETVERVENEISKR